MAGQSIKLLLIEDNENDYNIIKRVGSKIKEIAIELDRVSNQNHGIKSLNESHYDACLLDYYNF